jgi:hypothetical protein
VIVEEHGDHHHLAAAHVHQVVLVRCATRHNEIILK